MVQSHLAWVESPLGVTGVLQLIKKISFVYCVHKISKFLGKARLQTFIIYNKVAL